MDKHSSLLRKLVNYGEKSFITLAHSLTFEVSSQIKSVSPMEAQLIVRLGLVANVRLGL